MFYSEYLRLKKIREVLFHKLEKQEQKINQEIWIHDLMVYPERVTKSFGEAQNYTATEQHKKYPPEKRLIDHVELLANIANASHQKYYCHQNKDHSYSIKPDCLNKITRLCLNEFSLYTPTPLSIKDFNLFIDNVTNIAKAKLENVHLLLSSIAVLNTSGQVLNISLYVQCGPEPKLEIFCKGVASPVDFKYPSTENFTQRNADKYKNVSGFIGLQQDATISNHSVFTVQTAGGAKYTQAVDVCYDHNLEHSKSLLTEAASYGVSEDTCYIPKQADHIVTSATTYVDMNSAIAKKVIHIDPMPRNRILPMLKDKLTFWDLKKVKKPDYANTVITKSEDGFLVTNPPFGAAYEVVAAEERKLEGYTNSLAKKVVQKNIEIVKAAERQAFAQLHCKLDEFQACDVVFSGFDAVLKIFNELRNSLLKITETNFLERLFKTHSYRLKQVTKSHILNSFTIISKLNEPENLVKVVNTILKDLSLKLKHINHGITNDLSRKCIKMINEATEEISAIKLRL